MAFKTGDRVFLLNSDEHGTITRFVSSDEVTVKMGNSEITVFTAMLRPFTEKDNVTVTAPLWEGDVFNNDVFTKYAPEVLLCFVPVTTSSGSVDTFAIHIVNTLPFRIACDLALTVRNSVYKHIELVAQPGRSVEAGVLPFDDLNAHPQVQLSVKSHEGKLFDTTVKLRAKSFFNKQAFVPVLNTDAYVYTLFTWQQKTVNTPTPADEDIDINIFKAGMKQTSSLPAALTSAFSLTPRYEVDLHIEKLSDEHMLMNVSEILDTQVRVFEKELDDALRRRQPSIVFIHGVGKGTLRREIIRRLDTHPHVRHHNAADFNKYGQGAIEVTFKL